MSNLPDLKKGNFGLTELEEQVLELTLQNELNVNSKHVTNKQMAATLGCSEANIKRIKAKESFQNAKLALSKNTGKQLLGKAVRELDKILDDPAASGTTKIKAIQTVYQSVGMTKAPEEATGGNGKKQGTSDAEIDALLKRYNIRDSEPKKAEKVEPES